MNLNDTLPEFAEYVRECKAKGICAECKEPALPKCYSEAGRREYGISGLCEPCFDEMFSEDEGDDEAF